MRNDIILDSEVTVLVERGMARDRKGERRSPRALPDKDGGRRKREKDVRGDEGVIKGSDAIRT